MTVGQRLSLPADSTGLSISSAASAWGYGTAGSFSASLSVPIAVLSLSIMPQTSPGNDITDEVIFDVMVNGVTVLQIPAPIRTDSAAEFFKPIVFSLPEPMAIASGTAVTIKVADNLTSARTYTAVKLFYREIDVPSITLNSPADASSVSLMPTFDFTGSTTENDSLEYQIQFGNELPPLIRVIAESTDPTITHNIGANPEKYARASNFVGDGNTLYSSTWKLRNPSGASTGSMRAVIWFGGSTLASSPSGSPGSYPLGTPLAISNTVNIASITNTASEIEFTFPIGQQMILSLGVIYSVILEWVSGTGTLEVSTGGSAYAGLTWTHGSADSNGAWSGAGGDDFFRLKSNAESNVVDHADLKPLNGGISPGGYSGQSFTGDGSSLLYAYVWLSNTSATGTLIARIYAETHATAFGTDSVPTGASLASSNSIDATTITTTAGSVKFTFSGADKIVLTAGVKYCLAIEHIGGAGSVSIGDDNASNAHNGNYFQGTIGSPTAFAAYDLWFSINSDIVDFDASSLLNSGFSNPDNGGDTHPFGNNENIQYVVSSNLIANQLYYWHVRAFDGFGWGPWSSIRSFTTVDLPKFNVIYGSRIVLVP